MIVSIKYPKQLLELNGDFIKFVRYKVNIQNSIESPYSQNKQKVK